MALLVESISGASGASDCDSVFSAGLTAALVAIAVYALQCRFQHGLHQCAQTQALEHGQETIKKALSLPYRLLQSKLSDHSRSNAVPEALHFGQLALLQPSEIFFRRLLFIALLRFFQAHPMN